jgi:alkylation response protein AidB-like acyl-CoA dehydrogenase
LRGGRHPQIGDDFYELVETLPADELAVVKQVRTLMETKVSPIITKYWVNDEFPFELLPAIKELDIGRVGMKGYGCRGGSAQLFGLIAMEMARFDSSIATFFGVHNGLPMGSIYLGGSEEQKQKWLPPMARWEKIGCFGRTEPLVGSGARGRFADNRKAGRRHMDPQWSEEVDRQLHLVRHFHHLGSRSGQPS